MKVLKDQYDIAVGGSAYIRTTEGEWVIPATGEEYTIEELEALDSEFNA
ncbi:hypothetical protein [Corynebacterium vitaeruminis]|nr:hypothetical protein [Corynebacterium vitaeruminis]